MSTQHYCIAVVLCLHTATPLWAQSAPAATPAATAAPAPPATPAPAPSKEKLQYTTYFYTPGQAVIHAYEDGTNARIARLGAGSGSGTVWQGTLKTGQAEIISTGDGMFAFLSDKKAGLLVGTPTSCQAVGYFVADKDSSYRSDHFYSLVPSSSTGAQAKVVIWAWEDTTVTARDTNANTKIFEGALKAGTHHTIDVNKVPLSGHILEVRADKRSVSVEVYYDQGFAVPGKDGRLSGREFYAYLGSITSGANELELFSHAAPAKVKVTDLTSGATAWEGTIPAGKLKVLAFPDTYVHVVSDKEIAATVAPHEGFKGGYAEQHYAAGQEGSGIDKLFLITTPQDMWIFSYYANNEVIVSNGDTGAQVWTGTLAAGGTASLSPGWGFYQVKSTKGASVMAGFSSCGAAFSPAGGMFKVDDALFAVIQQIRAERIEQARAQGKALTREQAEAPLSKDELARAKKQIAAPATPAPTAASSGAGPAAAPAAAPARAPAASMSDDEVEERIKEIQKSR
jgi:hypothetical protein